MHVYVYREGEIINFEAEYCMLKLIADPHWKVIIRWCVLDTVLSVMTPSIRMIVGDQAVTRGGM